MPISEAEHEKAEQHLKFMKIDQRVYDFLGAETWQFWEQCMKQSAQAPLRERIERLEAEVLSRDLSIGSLKKENGLIWQTYIEKVAELEIEIKKLHNRYKAVLEYEKSNTE